MKDALILEHKTYISARRAAEITGYASDYIGQLCRAGKIESKIVGRAWFVLEESLLKHKLINDEVKTNKKTAKKRRALKAASQKFNNSSDLQFISKDEVRVGALLLTEKTHTNKAELVPTISAKSEPVFIKTELIPVKNISPEKKSSFSYEAVHSPLMPLLKKRILSEEAKKLGRKVDVRFVPAHFSMRRSDGTSIFVPAHISINTKKSNIDRKGHSNDAYKRDISYHVNGATILHDYVENFAAVMLLLIAIFGGELFLQSSVSNLSTNSFYPHVSSEASISSVSKDIVDSVSRGWSHISHKVAVFFGISSDSKLASNKNITDADSKNNTYTNKDLGFNGIAVVPSSNSLEKDELIKQRIRDSFSDEVTVHPDQSKTAGVITPVFKKATKDNFVYVLVPIQETKQ